jgi:hypothetical protein
MDVARKNTAPAAALFLIAALFAGGIASAATTDPLARARDAFVQLQAGKVDRSALTPAFSADLTADALATMSAGIASYGPPPKFAVRSKTDVDGVTTYVFRLAFSSGSVDYVFGIDDASGKIAKMYCRPGPPV